MKSTRGLLVVLLLAGIALLSLSFMSRPAYTQHELRSPEILREMTHDISAPLRDMTPAAHRTGPPEERDIRLLHQPRDIEKLVDPVLQLSTLPKVSTTGGSSVGGIGANGSAPPDTNGSVGATQFVEWVNTEFAVYNKANGALVLGPLEGNTLWSGFGGGCQTNNDGDIIVLWDKLNQRWVMSQFSVSTTPFNQCVAVSTTADATGTWARYAFQQPAFNDYPKLGVWPDAYYVTYNMFNSTGTLFEGSRLCAMDSAAMRAGTTATQQCFQLSSSFGGVLPADVDGTTLPPAGEPEFFLNFGTNSLNLWKFHVDFTTTSNTTLTGPTNLPVATFSEACGGGTCIPQSGVTQKLDSLGDRLMYRLAYRNFGSHESLVVNHSITAGSSVGVRWYELQNPGSNPVIFQQGTFAPDSNYRWMGSIAMDQAGDIALGYSVSSSTLHPAIRYTGRTPSDPLGTMESETSIFEGPGSQTGQSLSRWGDYSSMSVDPADDCTFWYSNEFLPSNGAFNWSTRFASFKFTGCGAPPTPDFSIAPTPSSRTVVQGNPTSYTVNTSALNGFSGNIAFSITSALPTGVGASFNPASVAVGASSTLNITTAAATAAGTYTITIQGASGTTTHTASVSLVVNPVAQPNFTVSASPSSQTVVQGSPTSYSVSTTAVNGFGGTIALSITSALPSGVGTSFNPGSVAAGASSTLNITTASTTPTGTYTLTIQGTSGTLTHTANVTLVVNPVAPPNFTISAAPSSRSVTRGNSTTYTVTIVRQNGFAGSVSLSVTNLPSRATGSFNPTSITGTSTTSTLTISTTSRTTRGTRTLTITGKSGSLSHSATVSLTVN